MLLLGFASACSGSVEARGFAPVVLTETRELDPEVLTLAAARVADAERSPASAAAHGALGIVYEANWIYDAAEKSYDQASRLDPSNTLWRFHRALALREVGRTDEAHALVVEAARERPAEVAIQQRAGAWLQERGDLAGARAAFTRALAAAKVEHADLLAALACVDADEERWDDAEQRARRALARDPSAKLAHQALARALQARGRDEEARRAFAAASGAKPRFLPDALAAELEAARVNHVAQTSHATRLMSSGRHAQALPIAERVLAKRPDDVLAIKNVAACLQETGQTERALALLRRGVELAPRDEGVQLEIADAQLRSGNARESLAAAQRCVELAPELGRGHLARGRALAALERLEDASAAVARSLRLEPENWNAQATMAELCLRRKQREEARAWVHKLAQCDAANVPARANAALLFLRLGEVAAARERVAELERFAPDDPRVRALRAELERVQR